MKKQKEEDFNLVIMMEEEALWTRVKENTDKIIKSLEDDLVINKALKELAEQKLKNIKE